MKTGKTGFFSFASLYFKIYGAHRKKSGSSVQRIHTCCLQRAHGKTFTFSSIRLCLSIIFNPLFHSNTVAMITLHRPSKTRREFLFQFLSRIIDVCKFLVLLVLLIDAFLETFRFRHYFLSREFSSYQNIFFQRWFCRPLSFFPLPTFCFNYLKMERFL